MYFCQNSALKERIRLVISVRLLNKWKVVRFHWKAFEWLYQMKHYMTGTKQILIVPSTH